MAKMAEIYIENYMGRMAKIAEIYMGLRTHIHKDKIVIILQIIINIEIVVKIIMNNLYLLKILKYQ